MGHLGKRLTGINVKMLLAKLTQAYADEWFAHYNYRFVAHALRGHRSPAVTELMIRKSADAFRRANLLAERILEVGGQPIAKLTDLVEHATDKPFKLPSSMGDTDAVLRAVLDAERTSIRTYQALSDRVERNDPVTRLLVQGFLADAVHGEDELERLMDDPAPNMDGKA